MVFRGSKIAFEKREKIGFGGNADVFLIDTENNIDYEVVAKFLRFETGNRFMNKYKRFLNEIKAVEDLNNKMDGLLPIIDYYTPENPHYNNLPWYIMPYAKPLKDAILGNGIHINEKVGYLREVAVILSKLHKNGYAHRDIKLGNIFIYENNIKLGDFGLVWHEAIDGLTKNNERIGAWTTMAPEMKRYAGDLKYPFPADVYSFTKLLWIVLTEDTLCFDGQYSKNKPFILKCDDFEVNTLEDIHDLIERGTKDNHTERPEIDECIRLIDKWADTNKDPRKYTRQNIDVLNKKIQSEYKAKTTTYDNFITIFDIVKDIIKFFYLESMQVKEFHPKQCVESEIYNCFEISDGRLTYILKPVALIKERIEGKETWYKYTLQVDSVLEKEILNTEKQIYINIKDMDPLSLILGNENMFGKKKIILNEEKSILFMEKMK